MSVILNLPEDGITRFNPMVIYAVQRFIEAFNSHKFNHETS